MKIRLLFLVFFVFCFSIYAQNGGDSGDESSISNQFKNIVKVPNSPEAEAFTKYGNYDTNLYTGTPNISVPLYTIRGREMNLPISLTYDASGMKVTQVSSNVGMGWNLNVGGRISRQVRGMPDHQSDIVGNESDTPADPTTRAIINQYVGFYIPQPLDNGPIATTVFGTASDPINDIAANVNAYYNFLTDVSKGKIDVEQDYFSLNIMGLNETLWMDTETYTPHPLKDPNIKIEEPQTFITDPTTWEVRDAEGNLYVFGHDYGSTPYPIYSSNPVEIVRKESTDDSQSQYNLKMTYNSSWLISKIVSKNGKDVYQFEYTNNTDFSNPEYPELIGQSTSHTLRQINANTARFAGAGDYPSYNKITSTKSYYSQQYLIAIYHNGKKIVRFNFGDREDIESGEDKKVTGFEVKEDFSVANNPIIEKIVFEQSYFGTQDPQATYYDKRLKLDKIKMKQNDVENFYSFDYFSPTLVPSRKSNAYDVMGFFNDRESPTPFRRWFRDGTDLELLGASREVIPYAAKVGTINKISYPTGGYTEFEFKNHEDQTGKLYPGLRIEKIKNYSSSGILETQKEYEYPAGSLTENVEPKLELVVSSQGNPCSSQSYPRDTGTTMQRYTSPPNMDGGPHITYTKVREYLYNVASNQNQDGYTEYEFKNERDSWINEQEPPFVKHYLSENDAGSPFKTSVYAQGNANPIQISENTYGSSGNNYSDQAYVLFNNAKRRYSFVKIYKSSGDVFVYTGDGTGISTDGGGNCAGINSGILGINGSAFQMSSGYCGSGEFCFPITGWAGLEIKPVNISAYKRNLVTAIKTEVFGSNQIVTTTSNDYSPDGMFLTSSNVTLGNNLERRTEYTYPKDIPAQDRTSAETSLINQNKLSQPIITKTKKIDTLNNSEVLLSTDRIHYKNEYGLPLPKYIQKEKGGSSNLENRIEYKQYDDQNNPIEVSLTDGSSVCYIWGYDYSFPVAKIENMEYDNLNNVSVLIENIETETDETALNTLLNQLRNHNDLEGALVTSYTYKPMVGVSTITDPKGDRITYHYDDNNRLQYIKDKDQNVLSENTYNYRTKNEITGGSIDFIGQYNDANGYYLEFDLDTSDILPVLPSWDIEWSSSNDDNIVLLNNDLKARVYYDCNTLQGDALQISVKVSDPSEDYYPLYLFGMKQPDSCTIKADIVSNPGNGQVVFQIVNEQGGVGGNEYQWSFDSLPVTGMSYDTNAMNGSSFTVTYDCNVMLDAIRVSCTIEDNAQSSSNFYKVEDDICQIKSGVITLEQVDRYNNFFKFKINGLSDGHPDGFNFYWGITNDEDCITLDSFEVDGVTLPYADDQGYYYLGYECTDCDENDIHHNNLELDIFVDIRHDNGSSLIKTWSSNGNIPSACQAQ